MHQQAAVVVQQRLPACFMTVGRVMGEIIRMLIEEAAGSCRRAAAFCAGAWTAVVWDRRLPDHGGFQVFTGRATFHATQRTAGLSQPQ